MKIALLPILVLILWGPNAAYADQKPGQQTNPPPPSVSDQQRKYCYDKCEMVNGLCVRVETICK